jgi:hypothetical protein
VKFPDNTIVSALGQGSARGMIEPLNLLTFGGAGHLRLVKTADMLFVRAAQRCALLGLPTPSLASLASIEATPVPPWERPLPKLIVDND